jgi:hypothetical protein
MKPKAAHYSQLANRIARQTAKLASIATANTVYGGASALVLAKACDRLGVKFSDGVSGREIVSHVYGNSTGRTCERFGPFECVECGCVSLGLEMAFACCAETEEEISPDTLDGLLDGQNLDGFACANELREHGEEMESKGAPSTTSFMRAKKRTPWNCARRVTSRKPLLKSTLARNSTGVCLMLGNGKVGKIPQLALCHKTAFSPSFPLYISPFLPSLSSYRRATTVRQVFKNS